MGISVFDVHIVELLLSSDMVVEEEHQWPAHFQKFGRHTVMNVSKDG